MNYTNYIYDMFSEIFNTIYKIYFIGVEKPYKDKKELLLRFYFRIHEKFICYEYIYDAQRNSVSLKETDISLEYLEHSIAFVSPNSPVLLTIKEIKDRICFYGNEKPLMLYENNAFVLREGLDRGFLEIMDAKEIYEFKNKLLNKIS